MKRRLDVAVIGGGPAGATLGRLLAAAGMDVAIFEKERLPRHKPCGGGVTAKAFPLLPPEALQTAVGWATAVQLRCGSLCATAVTPGAVAALVSRDRFDHALCQAAAAAGARLLEGCPARVLEAGASGCQVEAAGEVWHSRFVALAWGALGGRGAGRPRWVPALEAELDVGAHDWREKPLLDFGAIPWGYGWIFPKGPVLSVGVGTSDAAAGHGLRHRLERFLEQYGLGRLKVVRQAGYPLPLGGVPRQALSAGPVLRLGDAAGLCDPLFGEGIAYALQSAHLAAQALLAGDPLAYGRGVERDILRRHRRLAVAARAVYPWIGRWVQLAGRLPRLTSRTIVRLMGVAPL